jgi:hypothetical protein
MHILMHIQGLHKMLRSLKRIRGVKGYFSGPDGAQKHAVLEEHVSLTCQFEGLGYCMSPRYMQMTLSAKKSFRTPLPAR